MRDEQNERFPSYVPAYYRLLAKARKLYRQTQVRINETRARKGVDTGIEPEGELDANIVRRGVFANPVGDINKCAAWIDEDLNRPGIQKLTEEIDNLKKEMEKKGLKYTNTAGTFLSRMFYPRSEKTKLWENCWTIHHSGVKKDDMVLDIGGASTIFSFYLASMGCKVNIVDNDWGNCATLYNSRYVAQKMEWYIKTFDKDVAMPLPFSDNHFDKIFSICTLEHLSSGVRRCMMREVQRVLKPGGIAALTMCYCNELEELMVDKGLRFGYYDKLKKDVIIPSGLEIYGNETLVDVDPDKDFLGTLFLVKK
jgi:SAM-dependent methyltransferase